MENEMKKHIIKISLVFVATFLSFSCNDEFLDRTPLDQISSGAFWNTENDLLVYNNTFYHIGRREDDVSMIMGHDEGFDSHFAGIWYIDGFSDNTGPRHARSLRYQEVRAGKHPLPENPQIYGHKGFNFLRAINFGLENYDKAKVSQEIKNKYIGEARFFRAWFYADKVSKFGNMQWVDRTLNIGDDDILYGERDDRTFVMDKVLEDINFAVANIPNNWGDGGAPGRVNRWGVLLIKSRICLFEGTWRKYHGITGADSWLQAAAEAAKELIDNGPYSLYSTGNPNTDYSAIHHMHDLSGNPEVIYWRRYDASIYTNHVQSYHKDYNGGATKSAVEDYLCSDGLPISVSPLYQGDEVYEGVFENRDPRLRQTVLHPEDQPIYRFGNHDYGVFTYPRVQGMAGGTPSYTGYHIIKVFEVVPAFATYNTSTTPAIIMRFGEALLNYAEARAELGTITQGDLDLTINKLRDRVGMPHLDISNVPVDPRYVPAWHSDPLIVEIRRERRIELFMEGFRYDDLRRWKWGKLLETPDYGMRWDDANKNRFDPQGQATVQTTLINGVPYLDVYKGTDFAVPVFDESKHYLFPIPINVRADNPKLAQNPGWN
jgi:starch-binding outer membrane protein, SusD/RagB family